MQNNVNPVAALYDKVADEYIDLLHTIQDLPSGPRKIELFDATYDALDDNGTAESQLAALADVRRDLDKLTDHCPCGEGRECCCSIDATAPLMADGSELP